MPLTLDLVPREVVEAQKLNILPPRLVKTDEEILNQQSGSQAHTSVLAACPLCMFRQECSIMFLPLACEEWLLPVATLFRGAGHQLF